MEPVTTTQALIDGLGVLAIIVACICVGLAIDLYNTKKGRR
jgi:Na+/H+-dicarboxylate symporter